LTAAYEQNLREIYYQYFGTGDGIVNTEFNGGCQPCGIQLANGLYSFPTMNGMVLLDPRQPHSPPPAGQVFIDEIKTDSVSHDITDSALFHLPDGIKNIRFRLSLPEFGNPENIYFAYRLDPYSDDWEVQDITQNNTLQFGRLKPGNYTLYLRVRNGFEAGQFRITTLAFRILEPWYNSWWFYLLCFAASVLFVWLLVRWRTAAVTRRKEMLQQLVNVQTRDIEDQRGQLVRQLQQLQSQQARLEEDNEVKTRLIGIISHDMMSPLNFMAFMGRKLRDIHASTPAAHELASFIVTVAQQLEALSSNILTWIRFHLGAMEMKPEPFDWHQLVTESVEIAATLAKEKGLALYNEVPHLELVQYRQALGVIVYNLAMNAVKYTLAGEVRISGRRQQQYLFLSVTDTGPGMEPAMVEKLNATASPIPREVAPATKSRFGYVIIKDLLQLVGGDLRIESTPLKGTRVTIRLSFELQSSDNGIKQP
jgi:signal transduction histidine kinase